MASRLLLYNSILDLGKSIVLAFNLNIIQKADILAHWLFLTGMRKFRIDQDFLIEHWHMIYVMPVVFAEIYV